MFRKEIFSYYPGEYFNCLGFIEEPKWSSGILTEDGKAMRFKYTPYRIDKLMHSKWVKPNIQGIWEVLVTLGKPIQIEVPLDSFFSKDDDILFHFNPRTNKYWLTIHELGGIQYLRSYGKLKQDYRILREAIENFKYTSEKKDHELESLRDSLDHVRSELNILRPENKELVDSISEMRNSMIDLSKRLEHFRDKAESFKGMYEESTSMIREFGIIASSLKDLVIEHARTYKKLTLALTGTELTKTEKLAREVAEYGTKLENTVADVQKALNRIDEIGEKQKQIEEKEVEKIGGRATKPTAAPTGAGIEETIE